STVTKELKTSLLLIDDDQGIVTLIGKSLERDDVKVLSTTSPREGLRIVHEQHPPIVIVDLEMPEMGDMDVLDEILHIDPKTEVILLTADYSTESAVRAIQKGASDYWTKPISL